MQSTTVTYNMARNRSTSTQREGRYPRNFHELEDALTLQRRTPTHHELKHSSNNLSTKATTQQYLRIKRAVSRKAKPQQKYARGGRIIQLMNVRAASACTNACNLQTEEISGCR